MSGSIPHWPGSDAVYHTLYKCNLRPSRRLSEPVGLRPGPLPVAGFGDTTDFDQIKRHYYQTQDWINPTRIVPKGPYVNWLSPPDRERLSART